MKFNGNERIADDLVAHGRAVANSDITPIS